MFLLQKSNEIGKSLILSAPAENSNEARNLSPPGFLLKMLDSIFQSIY